MTDKRKNIRISHEGSVQLASGNHAYHGKLVDISRTGMKIVANIPESPQTIKSVTFTLPKSDKPLQIPCRLIRKENERSNEEEQILGIEFFYKDEAQMLLIESFIKEMKMALLKNQAKTAEMRQIPRTNCVIKNISCDRKGVSVISIDNISIDGILISFIGE